MFESTSPPNVSREAVRILCHMDQKSSSIIHLKEAIALLKLRCQSPGWVKPDAVAHVAIPSLKVAVWIRSPSHTPNYIETRRKVWEKIGWKMLHVMSIKLKLTSAAEIAKALKEVL